MIICSAEEAVSKILSGNRVFIHSVAAAPQLLIKAMVARKNELKNVNIVQISIFQRSDTMYMINYL